MTELESLTLVARGKVRDLYDFGDRLLIVATDRISAYDVVMPNAIPDKGKVLTQLSRFWFSVTKDIVPNHLVSTTFADFPKECAPYRKVLEGRSMLVIKTEVLPIECVVRGYLSGSAWEEYQATGEVCGIRLEKGLEESDKLRTPIFTPATKAEIGQHDANITFERMDKIVAKMVPRKLRNLSIAVYEKARDYGERRGIIIADTKLEFGVKDDKILLIDEILTPDSSRFWSRDQYRPGVSQMSVDKQFLRDYLNGLDWPKQPPPPRLPEEIIDKTRDRYMEALKRLTGHGLE
jgi:phosphoribosylaminoimidazole-succinocarboxamide synthase